MVLKLPDDVYMEVPIEHMSIKDSLFVPTLKVEATRKLISRVADEIQIQLSMRVAVVDGYLGLLFYRVR